MTCTPGTPIRHLAQTVWPVMLIALAIAVSACGSESAVAVAAAESTASDSATTTTVVSEVIELSAVSDPGDLRFETFAALGGVRVGFDADSSVFSEGDIVGLATPVGDADPGSQRPAISAIALVSQTLGANPIANIEDFLSLAREGGVTVEPSGTAIEALGLRLEGYKLELTSAQPNFFLAANRLGEDASSAYAMESAQMFLADVDGGVLLLFADGADEDARATALGRLGDMVETAELLGPLNFPSPSFPKSGEPASRPELGVNDPELPLLEAQHRPIDPGRYQVTRLGDTFALDVGEEWWAESNTRGFVELASADSFAPGNNDLAFVAGLDRGLFSISGPNFVGEPDDLTDLPSWLESPPDGLTVSDIQEVDVGGRSATRFDISIADGADCQEAAPCEYWLFSPVETALVIKSGFDVRIWHIEDHEFAPLTIMTSTTGSTWIDEAGALVDTIEFLG